MRARTPVADGRVAVEAEHAQPIRKAKVAHLGIEGQAARAMAAHHGATMLVAIPIGVIECEEVQLVFATACARATVGLNSQLSRERCSKHGAHVLQLRRLRQQRMSGVSRLRAGRRLDAARGATSARIALGFTRQGAVGTQPIRYTTATKFTHARNGVRISWHGAMILRNRRCGYTQKCKYDSHLTCEQCANKRESSRAGGC